MHLPRILLVGSDGTHQAQMLDEFEPRVRALELGDVAMLRRWSTGRTGTTDAVPATAWETTLGPSSVVVVRASVVAVARDGAGAWFEVATVGGARADGVPFLVVPAQVLTAARGTRSWSATVAIDHGALCIRVAGADGEVITWAAAVDTQTLVEVVFS